MSVSEDLQLRLGALYGFSSPALDSDHALVEVARQLAELCKERLPECKVARLSLIFNDIHRPRN